MNILRNYLTDDECQEIIDSCGHKKRFQERFVVTEFALPQSVEKKLQETVGLLSVSCAVQFYEVGDRIFAHRDGKTHSANGTIRERVLSMSILLNDEFEGGDLMIEHKKANIGKGDAVVFSSSDLHWVRDIYEGTRRCLAVWGSK